MNDDLYLTFLAQLDTVSTPDLLVLKDFAINVMVAQGDETDDANVLSVLFAEWMSTESHTVEELIDNAKNFELQS